MIFNSYKQHIVFYDTAEVADQAVTELILQGIANYARSDDPPHHAFPKQVSLFNAGHIKALVLPKNMVTGWHTDLSAKKVDVHFTYRPTIEEMRQGKARVKGGFL